MQSSVNLDTIYNRVEIRANGQWNMADADEFHRQMTDVRRWSDRHGTVALSILSNLDGLVVLNAEIADRVALTVDQIRELRREKYALIVPSYLMRMQCRRLLRGIEHRIFETREEAMAWLGWRAFSPAGAA